MPTVIPMGEHALRISLPDQGAVLALYEALMQEPLAGQVDLVPGAESLLIQLSGTAGPGLAREAGARVTEPAVSRKVAEEIDMPNQSVVIETVYQGPDLDTVAELTGLSVEGIVAAHTTAAWRVAFCGFAPGFAYLSGGDPALAVPRRATPRSEVPAGTVGLAGEYSGVYPRSSPGGWQLIGRTDAALWDALRDPPALLRPGVSVTFRAVRPSMTLSSPRPILRQYESRGAAGSAQQGTGLAAARTLTVLRSGPQCLVQDLGRAGHADMGVSRSGAADRGALRVANRAAGNPEGAAVLEILLGGAELEAGAALTIALAGAPVAVSIALSAGFPESAASATGEEAAPKTPTYHEVPNPMERPIALPAGARIRLGRPARGLRTYLAVRGGIDVPPVLGSRSTDLLAGLGPTPVIAGQVLPIGECRAGTVDGPVTSDSPDRTEVGGGDAAHGDLCIGERRADTDVSVSDAAGSPGVDQVSAVLTILSGPQRDWFGGETWESLRTASWVVTPATNRTAATLAGPPPRRTVAGEAPSQGLVRGAIQVPPSGKLVAFLADHPVTGGYPVIAVLTDAAVDRLAQCRPGAVVRFRDAAAPTP
jgi:KipI family sensor histidine kinase inhibitor